MNKFLAYSEKTVYWQLLFLTGILLELAALYYQYVLDYQPCVLCIHIRVWVLGIITVALLAMKLNRLRQARLPLHLLMTIMLAGFAERSYQALGVERGFVFGDCNMESGLPVWFALDQWFPAVFKVLEACGYTPVLFFGVTMAEVLMLLSAVLLLISSVFLLTLINGLVLVKTTKRYDD